MKFRKIASAIGLVTALVVAGCQTQQQQHHETPSTTQAPPEVKKTTPPPSVPDAGWGEAHLHNHLVHLDKKVPSSASLGETYYYEHKVTSKANHRSITVEDVLGDGLVHVRSEPPANVAGQTLTWVLDDVAKDATRDIKVWVKAEKTGSHSTCSTVTSVPEICLETFVGEPAISITKTGPARGQVGDSLTYNIEVKNSGTAVAKDVYVIDNVPDGLAYETGSKALRFNIGDLAPNQAKQFPVVLKATQRGEFCNTAVVNSSNAGEATAEACTVIVQPGIDIVKTGPDQRFILKAAAYQIVVSNTGDTDLNNVVVTDIAPSPTSIASASGADVAGNKATWNTSLKAGEKKTFNVTLKNATPGNYCNQATVVAEGGLNDNAETCTLWKGLSAILIELVDDPDPVQVGDSTTYTIRVTNQGTADDTNVGIVMNFPAELTPITATGGTIDGKNVTFPAVARLGSKQSFTYTIVARGTSEGDGRIRAIMNSDQLETPVTEEEATRVY